MNIMVKNLFLMFEDRRFWKSVASSGITAVVDLSLLFIFREAFHLSYGISINGAFVAAIAVNFSLQKFWTFSNRDLNLARKQFAKFLLLAMGNVVMNGLFMFALLAVFGFWYLGAQIIVMGILALVNFVLYRRFVFNKL